MSPFASRQFSQFAINTMMLLLSLLFCFLLKLGTPILVQSCTDCWCVPGDGTFDSPGYSNFCPKLKKRELVYDNETIEGFLDYTEIGDFVGLEPPDCQPYPNLASALDQEPCDPVTTKRAPKQVCGFKYNSADGCRSGSNRFYELKTYRNKIQAIEDGAVITHTGRCGACSNHQDLAIYMKPGVLDIVSATCGLLFLDFMDSDLSLKPATDYAETFASAKLCFATLNFTVMDPKLGLSPDCAHVWASNSLNTAVNCWEGTCKKWEADPVPVDDCCKTANLLEQKPWETNNMDTCEINGCLKCDEKESGRIFKKYAGRTRRNSGIIGAIKRPCGSIENLKQDPCAVPNKCSR
jgi:hypothetical protein